MAKPLDLEEQEQIAQIRHFWARYGNLITWSLIVVLGTFAAWNGWQYWQRSAALKAAALYDELDRAVEARDTDRVQRVWADMQSNVGRTAQAPLAALLTAKSLQEAGQPDAARAALDWVLAQARDEEMVAIARLRLAALELEAQAHEAALRVLDAKVPAAFEGLFADRRGDALMGLGQRDRARAEYLKAYPALADSGDYQRIVAAKLNALGVDPESRAPTPQETTR
jgi:predicted negative regulator of RcsB-dependent stress response